jgi:hypothetical protein
MIKTKLCRIGAMVAAGALVSWMPTQANAQVESLLPLEIDEIVVEDGEFLGLGSLGGVPFATPITGFLEEGAALGDCPILDLRVGAIHLDLLGLNVDTSDICLVIAAEEGSGNLLGNLLCGVTGLLDGGLGLSLADLFDALTPEQQIVLLEGIRDVLNDVLAQLTAPENIVGVTAAAHPGQGNAHGVGNGQGRGQGTGGGRATAQGQEGRFGCDILNLALGPVYLDVLGLIVYLDDCNDGPVTVDITAERGQGRLLGNLLCSLAGLLDDDPINLDDLDIEEIVNLISDRILAIIGL